MECECVPDLHGDVDSDRPIHVEENLSEADNDEANDHLSLGEEYTNQQDRNTDEKTEATDERVHPDQCQLLWFVRL